MIENEEKPRVQTREEALARLTEIVAAGGEAERVEIENLKSVFYRQTPPKTEEEEVDELEVQFKEQLTQVKELRAKAAEQLAEVQKEGLAKKLAIIEEIKAMAETPETADKGYERMKELQAAWKEITEVPAEEATSLWKQYQTYTEQYYDMLRINHEMRAYDFKKNLEIKTRLCEQAEKLSEVEDVVAAFRQLQLLHQEFRETGPVAKELREEIWTRFKTASTAVNKRHAAHFENLKAQEEANLVAKTALCERVENIDVAGLQTRAEWDATTQEVLQLQAEWKTIGFAPKKSNQAIFDRFRAACDKFFTAKHEHYEEMQSEFTANLEAKTHLCERAEALKDSTDWSVTAEEIINLQKEWKTIGPVTHKVSNAIWTRFNSACNYFFEQKKAANQGQHEEEEANLEKKNAVIEKLGKLLENVEEITVDAVKALQNEWNEIGHVPFRKKDKIYKQYREVVDKLYDSLRQASRNQRVDRFRQQIKDGARSVGTELQRLQRVLEEKKQEIQTYETNLSFLTSKSKSGNKFVEDVKKRIEALKGDLEELKEKIKAARKEEKSEDD